jgi:hypothetical protein
VRFQTGGGSQQVSLGNSSSNSGALFGNNVAVPLGNRPFYPGKRPPYRPDVPCTKNPRPNLNGPAAAKSAPTGSSSAQAARASSTSAQLRRTSELKALRARLRPFLERAGVKKP